MTTLTLTIREDDSYLIDWSLEKVGSKMKNLEKLQIFLQKKYTGTFDFILPLLRGIQASNCNGLQDMRIMLDGEESGANTAMNVEYVLFYF